MNAVQVIPSTVLGGNICVANTLCVSLNSLIPFSSKCASVADITSTFCFIIVLFLVDTI